MTRRGAKATKKTAIFIVSIMFLTIFSNTHLAKTVNDNGCNQDMYRVLDSIEIDHVKGGFGVSAVIRNTGDITVSDIEWSIDFGALAKIGRYSSGTTSMIPIGDTAVIRSGFVFGIGSGSVKVVASEFSIVQKYIMIGPFVFLRHGFGTQIKNPDMIVYFRDGDQRTLDPADAYDSASTAVINTIYDRLITYKGNDSETIYPSLATDWSVADDQVTWTFHIRQGVTFSNGDALDANDVKYSLDRVLIVNSPDSGVAWILSQCLDTNSTTVIDPYTVQIKLTETYGGFLALLAFSVASIVDKETVEAHGGVIANTDNIWMRENAVGTGPYMIKSKDNNSGILLMKNPSYWGGWNGNHVDKVLFKTTPILEERISAIETGNADITFVPYANLTDVIGKKGIDVQHFDSYEVALLLMNTRESNNEYMADGRVRKALSFAFDYDTAIGTALLGYASRLVGAIPNGMPYYDTQNNGQPYYTYNLTKAEQILDDAGYFKDYYVHGMLFRFNGTELRIFYNTGNLERETMALMFQQSLYKIGILSVVIAEPWPQYLNRIYRTDDWEMAFLGWLPDYNDPDDYIVPLVGSAAIGGDGLHTGWANATVDAMILQGRDNVDPQIRHDAYEKAFNIYINEPSLIFAAQRMFVRPLRSWILNYSYNPAPGLEWNFYDCSKEGLSSSSWGN
jgi:peptide/nickel transport system substrate-binding protein